MAELKNRFLYVNAETWGKIEDKSIYNNSIVFVKNGTDGVAIYTQGATFGTLDEAEVRAIINSYGIAEGTNYAEDKAALEAAIEKALIDANDYTDAEIKKVSDALANKNVTAEGDAYVNATAADNKVTVTATDSTKASLALADSALQKADITTGSANGTIAVEGTDVAVAGLGSAAYTDSTAYDAAGSATAVKEELLGDAETYKTLGALEDAVEAINAGSKTYTVKPVTENLGANVEIAYQLYEKVGETETAVGSLINIPKDDSLVNVETTTDEKGNKVVKFTYNLADGTEKEITLDLSAYVTESEFGDGLQVIDNVVSVKLDSTSEEYLTVSEDGIKVSGIDTAISTAVTTAVEALDANLTDSAEGAQEGEVAVVSGVSLVQVDGKITTLEVESATAATKAYVDSKAAAATTTLKLGEGTEEFLSLTSGTVGTATEYTITINGVQTAIDGAIANLGSTEAEANKYITKIVVDKNGQLTNEAAYVSKAQLVDYTTTSTQKYVGIDAADTINGAFAKCEQAWDWAEIEVAE